MNLTWLYVGALYALSVAIARRFDVDLPKRIALLFYALVLVFFFKPMTQRYVNIPVDALTIAPPWSVVAGGAKFINADMNDVVFQHAPWAHAARESLKDFRAPIWNETAGSGSVLLANGQSSALSPIRILALPLSLGRAMTAEAAIKILIALTFTFLYCRGRGWSELASTFGAIAFGFGGFMAVWIHFPHVTTACFLPAVFYLIDRIAERRSFGAFVAAALTWAAIVYGGHPETASHIFVLALLYTIWIVAVERRASWRLLLALGGAMSVAALLSAPFLLTFVEAMPKSMRYQSLQEKPWSAEELPYSDARSSIVQVQPRFFGRFPVEGKWGPTDPDPLSGFAGTLGLSAWVALLIDVIRRRAWRSLEFFLVLASVFVFGVVMAWPGLGEGVHIVMPIVAHHRFRLLLAFLLALLTAFIVDRLERRETRGELLIGIGVVAVTIMVIFVATKFPERKWLFSALRAAVPTVAVLALAVAAAFSARRAVVLALLIAFTAEIWSATYPWSPPLREELMWPKTPMIEALQRVTAHDREPFRIMGWGATFFPNAATIFGFQDIRQHDPMSNAKYVSLLGTAAGYGTGDYFAKLMNIDTSLLDYLNVRYVLLDTPNIPFDAGRYELLHNTPDGWILRNRRALPRFYPVRNVILEFRKDIFREQLVKHDGWAHTALLDNLKLEKPEMEDDFFRPRPEGSVNATSRIVSADVADYHIAVSAPRWSLVVSSIPWWPGWKVTRNGERVEPIRVNGLFLGFAVPPGDTVVHVWYSPWTYWVGVWLALGTLVAIGICGSVVRGRRRRRASAAA